MSLKQIRKDLYDQQEEAERYIMSEDYTGIHDEFLQMNGGKGFDAFDMAEFVEGDMGATHENMNYECGYLRATSEAVQMAEAIQLTHTEKLMLHQWFIDEVKNAEESENKQYLEVVQNLRKKLLG